LRSTPSGWRAAEFGDVFRETTELRGERNLPVLSVTKTRGPMLASERFGRALHGRNLAKYRVAPRNSIVADPMLLWDGSIGRQTSADAGIVSPDYRVYKVLDGVKPEFMGFVVRNPAMLRHYQGGARGTNVRRNRIARGDFLRIPFLLPPPTEQRKIAAILSSVDEVIEKTEAVIEQLQVVKKAMMQDLLTRGLPGRHSRFQQTTIGSIPSAWEVCSLGKLVSYGPTNGRSPKATAAPGGVPTISIAAVKEGHVDIANNLKYARVDANEVAAYLLQPGDVLIVRGNGNPDLMGRAGEVRTIPVAGCIYPDLLMRVRSSPLLADGFLVRAWNSELVRDQLLAKAKTTNGIYKINNADAASTLLPVPPVDEQRQVVTVLKSLDEQISRERDVLRKARHAKSALMSVLLTGELRVTPDPESTHAPELSPTPAPA
jgi:type I restriction enzyme, S subunit